MQSGARLGLSLCSCWVIALLSTACGDSAGGPGHVTELDTSTDSRSDTLTDGQDTSGEQCTAGSDCVSGVCNLNTSFCLDPTCDDGVSNGAESSVDCGGDECAPCGLGRPCALPSDCASGNCAQGLCAEASCSDTSHDGDETDVDCGGSCAPCVANQGCETGSDCVSELCVSNLCRASSCVDHIANGDETDVDCGGICEACPNSALCGVHADCVSGFCQNGTCRAVGCSDSAQNGDETGVDCGGSCNPCADGLGCVATTDCQSGVCSNHLCQIPTCSDGAQNGSEGGLDCGGSTCPRCADGTSCTLSTDCSSKVCTANLCAVATCGDGVSNGGETGVDCGGLTCGPCGAGQTCVSTADCDSGVCGAGLCLAPSCVDGVRNGLESGVDCGGGVCGGCGTGEVCTSNSDCSNGLCDTGNSGLCLAPTCVDGVANGDESDVDCGGSACPTCGVGQACNSGADCAEGVCYVGGTDLCLAPTCLDGVKNQDETGNDCGGATCGQCGAGQGCLSATDCAQGVCDLGASDLCLAPTCADGVQNQGESDADCGGSNCGGCGIGSVCAVNADCAGNACRTNLCVSPIPIYAPNCDGWLLDGWATRDDCMNDGGWHTLVTGTASTGLTTAQRDEVLGYVRRGADFKWYYPVQNGAVLDVDRIIDHCNAAEQACFYLTREVGTGTGTHGGYVSDTAVNGYFWIGSAGNVADLNTFFQGTSGAIATGYADYTLLVRPAKWRQLGTFGGGVALDATTFAEVRELAYNGADFKIMSASGTTYDLIHKVVRVIPDCGPNCMWFYLRREDDDGGEKTLGMQVSADANNGNYWVGDPVGITTLNNFCSGTSGNLSGGFYTYTLFVNDDACGPNPPTNPSYSSTCDDWSITGWATREDCLSDGRWHYLGSFAGATPIDETKYQEIRALVARGADFKWRWPQLNMGVMPVERIIPDCGNGSRQCFYLRREYGTGWATLGLNIKNQADNGLFWVGSASNVTGLDLFYTGTPGNLATGTVDQELWVNAGTWRELGTFTAGVGLDPATFAALRTSAATGADFKLAARSGTTYNLQHQVVRVIPNCGANCLWLYARREDDDNGEKTLGMEVSTTASNGNYWIGDPVAFTTHDSFFSGTGGSIASGSYDYTIYIRD